MLIVQQLLEHCVLAELGEIIPNDLDRWGYHLDILFLNDKSWSLRFLYSVSKRGKNCKTGVVTHNAGRLEQLLLEMIGGCGKDDLMCVDATNWNFR
jgi:hypothetical protein